MKRTVIRCRANDSGQAWPGQAIDAVLPCGSLRRFFQSPISSPDTTTAHRRQRDTPRHHTRLSLPTASDPDPRSSQQSIPITDRLRQEFPKITDYSARPAWTDTFFYRNTDGRCHDVNALDALMAEPGAFYVMDRGYLDLDGFNEEDLIPTWPGYRTDMGELS